MKSSILSTTIAGLLGLCPLGLAQEKPTKTNASSSVTTNADGTATVTIEVDGKKETRTFKLGSEDSPTLTLKSADGQISAVGGAKRVEAGKKRKETFIGVGMGAPVSDEVRAQLPIQPGEGISVSHVMPDSPAAQAGIEQHDILVRLDDQILVAPDQFKALVKMHKPGEALKIGFFRKGERKEVSVTLTEQEISEGRDVLRSISQPYGTWEDKLHALKDRSPQWLDTLKEAKNKFPGIVIDKKAFVLGVDGTVKKLEGELQNVEAVIRNLGEKLEKANIPKEAIDRVREAVEDAIEKAGDTAAKAAIDALQDLRPRKEKLEAPVVRPPAPPVPPVPPTPPGPPAPPAQ
jgi:hypothetical protein